MTSRRAIAALATLAGVLAAAPAARAETTLFGRSTTAFQLRQDLDGVLRAPLYETLHGAMTADLPGRSQLSSLALLKLGTVWGSPEGTVDLYLLTVGLHRYRHQLSAVAGRQLLRTPRGLSIVDGVSLRLHPTPAIALDAAAGWLRDTETDDFGGGAFLLQGGAGLTALPGTYAGLRLGFRAGPDTSPRADLRTMAEAVIPAPLSPRPWIDASFRLDDGGLRSLRGGVVLTPIHLVSLEVRGSIDRVVDEDGTLARRILATLADAPVASIGGIATVRAPGGWSVTGSYWRSRYEVGPDLDADGHGADASVGWQGRGAGIAADYTFRASYGGLFHGVGGGVWAAPHRLLRLDLHAKAVPFRKGDRPWALAQWYRADATLRPNEHIDLALGAEYRSGSKLAHDLRLNASLVVTGDLSRRSR